MLPNSRPPSLKRWTCGNRHLYCYSAAGIIRYIRDNNVSSHIYACMGSGASTRWAPFNYSRRLDPALKKSITSCNDGKGASWKDLILGLSLEEECKRISIFEEWYRYLYPVTPSMRRTNIFQLFRASCMWQKFWNTVYTFL